jgi:hypothetical protein
LVSEARCNPINATAQTGAVGTMWRTTPSLTKPTPPRRGVNILESD